MHQASISFRLLDLFNCFFHYEKRIFEILKDILVDDTRQELVTLVCYDPRSRQFCHLVTTI